MSHANLVILVGKVIKKPYAVQTDYGAGVKTVVETTRDADGRTFKEHNFVLGFGPLGDSMMRLTEGEDVAVEGRIRSRKVPSTGAFKEMYVTEVNAVSITTLTPSAECNQMPVA